MPPTLRKRRTSDDSPPPPAKSDVDKSARYPDVHKLVRPSILSSETKHPSTVRVSNDNNSFRGFLNLCLILLFLSNLRVVIENIRKYGVLVDFIPPVGDREAGPAVFITTLYVIPIAVAWATERLAVALPNVVTHRVAVIVHVVNTSAEVIFPGYLIQVLEPGFLAAVAVMMVGSMVFMKLVSYASVNRELRVLYEAGKLPKVPKKPMESGDAWLQYPDNLTVSNMIFFLAVPSFCYQLNYVRTPRIRPKFLAKRIAEWLGIFVVLISFFQQYMMPVVTNTMPAIEGHHWSLVGERLLKIAVPNLAQWLLGFYHFFHVYLNIMAEITRFGDRHFYSDWWNSTTLADFWRTWNLPVHNWLMRHVYKPLLRRGVSRPSAVLIIFFISSFFHEYLVSVPARSLKLWAFMSMMIQAPLVLLGQKLKGKTAGNIFFWVSILVGQPVVLLLYYQDHYIRHLA